MLSRWKIRIFRRFGHEERGLAALEFALILPVLITMLFGMGELSLAVFARADVAQVAGTVADLVAQEQAVASTDLRNVYYAANMILYPNSGTPSIRITSVIYNTSTNSDYIGKVAWSCAQAGNANFADNSKNARATNSAVTLQDTNTPPQNQHLLVSGGSVLIAEVAYQYSTPTSMLITGPITMSDQFYTKPRRVGQIAAPASCP